MEPEIISKWIENPEVLYIYKLPRDLYGIDSDKSNYIIVVKDTFIDKLPDPRKEFCYNIFYIDNWFNRVLTGDLLAWECACLNKKYIIKEHVKLLLKTDPLQLRRDLDKMIKTVNFSDTPSKGLCLRVLKYIAFANQIIENHKIVNYNILRNAYLSLKGASENNLQEIFYSYLSPQYTLLRKYTDGMLLKAQIKIYDKENS